MLQDRPENFPKKLILINLNDSKILIGTSFDLVAATLST